MAESELITKEDVEEIASVLQLNPHHKNTTFTTVTKSEEGDLVSLDELYEKTGQESINKMIKGFEKMTKQNKLGREHGMALNIAGAESWMVIPDRLNVIRGGEGFISSIKNGIITIVKAIIKFVQGIYNWIVVKLKALLGWGKTSKETAFLLKESENIKANLLNVIKGLGLNIADKELDKIPDGLMINETFDFIKKKIEGNKEAFDRLEKASELVKDYKNNITKWSTVAKDIYRKKNNLISNLNKKAKNNDLTSYDIEEFSTGIVSIIVDDISKNNPTTLVKELADVLYDIKLDGLDELGELKELTTMLKEKTETVKIGYNDGTLENVKSKLLRKALETLVSKTTTKIDTSGLEQLKSLNTVDDAKIIELIGSKVPDSKLSQRYLSFVNECKNFTNGINTYLTLVQQIELNVNKALRWKSKVDRIISAYVVNDLLGIGNAIISNLTKEEQERFYKTNKNHIRKNDEGSYEVFGFVDIGNKYILDIGQGYNIETVSTLFNMLFSTPFGNEVMQNYKRFKNQLVGG